MSQISIHRLTSNHIPALVETFQSHNWPKPAPLFAQYLREQEAKERYIWVAIEDDNILGYVTLALKSKYQPFLDDKIPEIMDLNVLPPYRNRGIGYMLLETAEVIAQNHSEIVGIGVGLYEGYGNAQKLYIARGYIPDGLGITHNYRRVQYGETPPLDDDLVLWFRKKI